MLCSNCVLGTVDSRDYNLYFQKAEAGKLIAHIQEKKAQRDEDAFLDIFVEAFDTAFKKRDDENALKAVDTALRELCQSPDHVAWFCDICAAIA